MTHHREPCQLVPMWLMTFHLEHCHTSSIFMVAKLKKDRLNLTLMTQNREPCQLIPIWRMTFPVHHCYTSNVFMVAKLKKTGST